MFGTPGKLNGFLNFLICVTALFLPISRGHAQAARGGDAELRLISAPMSPAIRSSAGFLLAAEPLPQANAIDDSELVFRPASWQDWLLIVLLLAGGAVAVLLLWRWRQRDLVHQKRALEDAVQRRTQDLESEKKELLHAREQMRHYAERDGLTGLWNHRIIIDQLRREVDRAQRNGTPLSIILADLDRFKSINDTFGHPCGDAVLRAVAEILTSSVRSYDWVGRYGGEEFLTILPGASLPHARSRAEQLRASIESARIPDGGRTIQITASLGVASGVPADFEGLLRAADAALYRAKHSGRNCVVATEVDPPCQP